MTLITSRRNSKIRWARSLRRRKARRESGFFLVEGIFHVGEAQAAERLEAIFYAPELLESDFAYQVIERASSQDVPCHATSPDVFESLAGKDNPQGIVAVVRWREWDLDELNPDNFPWGVALVAPQDPGNVGTILRTIDSVGASGLILLDESVDPTYPSAVRASMGALFWHPVVMTSFNRFSDWADKWGYHVYGTSAHGDLDYRRADAYQRPLFLLMGSEREGLTDEQARICRSLLRIPMQGRVSSLNLGVATGIMLYAVLDSLSPAQES
jgi:TrmH family RNA methyltransferase